MHNEDQKYKIYIVEDRMSRKGFFLGENLTINIQKKDSTWGTQFVIGHGTNEHWGDEANWSKPTPMPQDPEEGECCNQWLYILFKSYRDKYLFFFDLYERKR